jgi:hypothetical protein
MAECDGTLKDVVVMTRVADRGVGARDFEVVAQLR